MREVFESEVPCVAVACVPKKIHVVPLTDVGRRCRLLVYSRAPS